MLSQGVETFLLFKVVKQIINFLLFIQFNSKKGFFVTVGYYALDHFNPERIKNRDHYRKHGYPNVGLARHLEHIFGIFAVIFHAITFLDVLPESYQSEV